MPKVALTDLSVRALKAPARGQYTVWDKISPIGIRVSQGGSKTFIVMIGSGQRKVIGRAGIISLADARREAKRLLAEKTLGLSQKPSTKLFEIALPEFIEQNYRGKAPRSKHEIKRLLTAHFLVAFGKKVLSAITDADISKELDKLAHVPSEQLHAFRALRVMLKWCTRPPRRYIRYSPLEGYQPPSEDKQGTRVLTDGELVKVWNACEGMFGAMIRLIILWGTRKGETARLMRNWIEDDVLTIPGKCTKNRRAHAIPLLPLARDILSSQQNVGRFYFPGNGDPETHFNDGSWGKLKNELDQRSGVTVICPL